MEISIIDVMNFLKASWARLVAGSVVGSIFGLTYWYFLTPYYVQHKVLNVKKEKILSNADLKFIQDSLPILENKSLNKNEKTKPDTNYYAEFSDSKWWKRNIIPTYSSSTNESSEIFSLRFIGTGKDKENASEMAKAAITFFYSRAVYLELDKLLKNHNIKISEENKEALLHINNFELQLLKMQNQIKFLKELKINYQDKNRDGYFINDVNNRIDNEIINMLIKINDSTNALADLKNHVRDREKAKVFLTTASKLTVDNFDGFVLAEELLKIDNKLHVSLTEDEPLDAFSKIKTIRKDIEKTKSSFFNGEKIDISPPHVVKSQLNRSLISGAMSGFLLILFWLLLKQFKIFAHKS
jgi:hypothetical protein